MEGVIVFYRAILVGSFDLKTPFISTIFSGDSSLGACDGPTTRQHPNYDASQTVGTST